MRTSPAMHRQGYESVTSTRQDHPRRWPRRHHRQEATCHGQAWRGFPPRTPSGRNMAVHMVKGCAKHAHTATHGHTQPHTATRNAPVGSSPTARRFGRQTAAPCACATPPTRCTAIGGRGGTWQWTWSRHARHDGSGSVALHCRRLHHAASHCRRCHDQDGVATACHGAGVQPMTAWWLQMQMRRPHQQPQRSTPPCPRRHCHHPCHQHRRSLHRHRHQARPTS